MEILINKLKEKGIEVNPEILKEVLESNQIFVLDSNQLKTLKDSVQKTGYDKAHGIAYKNAVRDLAKEFELEIDTNLNFDDVKTIFKESIANKYNDNIKSLESQLSKTTSEKIKEFETKFAESQKSIQNLQNLLKEKENAILKEKQERFYDKANSDFISELSKINIVIPAEIQKLGNEKVNEYLERQIKIATTIFKSEYDYKFDENGNYHLTDKQGNILKDKLENPLKLNDIVTNITSNYLTVTTQPIKQRGDGDKTGNSMYSNLKDENEVIDYCKKNGINPMSPEAAQILLEINKK